MKKLLPLAAIVLLSGCSMLKSQNVNPEQCVGVMTSKDAYGYLNPHHFTMQVLALTQEKDVRNYIQKIDPKHPVWVNWKNSRGSRWYTVTVGNFTTKQEALNAIGYLPSNVKQSAPFVMSFSEMQSKQETSVVRMR